eukprot:366436-Chlamydomonas_euryale.AAC.23
MAPRPSTSRPAVRLVDPATSQAPAREAQPTCIRLDPLGCLRPHPPRPVASDRHRAQRALWAVACRGDGRSQHEDDADPAHVASRVQQGRPAQPHPVH